jgi:hypothetical protein
MVAGEDSSNSILKSLPAALLINAVAGTLERIAI